MRSRTWPRILLGDAAILAVLAIGAELVLRGVAPVYGRQLFDNAFTGSFPVDANEDHYRGRRVPVARVPGVTRVLALGDSITFGTGQPSDAAWPAQLERLLAGGAGPSQVINGGVEGASLRDLAAAWDSKWAAYRPDQVILALTGNMVALEVAKQSRVLTPDEHFSELHREPTGLSRIKLLVNRYIHRFCLPSFLSIESQRALYHLGLLNHDVDPALPFGVLLAHGVRQGSIDGDLAGKGWQELEQDLRILNDKVRSGGAVLVVTYVPARFDLTTDASDNEKNVPLERFSIDPIRKAGEISERLAVPYVDARAALLDHRGRLKDPGSSAPLYIFFDYAHLDSEGHQALAAAVAARISSMR